MPTGLHGGPRASQTRRMLRAPSAQTPTVGRFKSHNASQKIEHATTVAHTTGSRPHLAPSRRPQPPAPHPITRTLSLSSSCLAHPLSTEARVAITCRSGHTTYVSRRSSSFPNAHIPFATLCHCCTCMLRTAFASLHGWLYVEPVAITRTSYGTGSHQFSTVKCVSLTDDTTPRIHLHPGRHSLWRIWIECACSGSTIHRRMLGVNSKKWHCHLHQKGKERSARATGCASE